MDEIHSLKKVIKTHASNHEFLQKGWGPVFTAHPDAKILIIGQAPGLAAQESGIPWNDVSGNTLRAWLGVSDEVFYDETKISLLPMDFYYPGKNPKGGDLPPRADFADLWHKQLIDLMSNIKLTILVGNYAQKHYLADKSEKNLTENVRSFEKFLPELFPIVHPSPLAGRWRAKNPWFEADVLPKLKEQVSKALD